MEITQKAIERYKVSADASHYLLIPQFHAIPKTAEEIVEAIDLARKNHTHITFRSGGTSLSGQAISDCVLVDTRKHFKDIEILNNGLQVRVQPGVTVRMVNAHLMKFGRKLGPDPASEVNG